MSNNNFDINNILKSLEQLLDVLNKETESLKNMNMDFFSEIYEEKIKLIDRFIEIRRYLDLNKDVLKELPENERGVFKDLALKIDIAKQENYEMLIRAIEVNKAVVTVIKNTLFSEKNNEVGYGSDGGYNVDYEDAMPSLAFNESV